VSASPSTVPLPRSLVWATDIDVLPSDRVVERRDGYFVVRSPSNPSHWWGNFLIFDDPPAPGDGAGWERSFELEFGGEARLEHRAFGWDHREDALGAAGAEFVSQGYEVEETVGLVATPDGLRSHPRENPDVAIRSLNAAPDEDEELWDQVVELQVADRDQRQPEQEYRDFTRRRLEDLRGLFRACRGQWFVALEPDQNEVVGSCGIVVTGSRARFQAVETAASHRRRGICSRLVVEAARRAHAHHHIEHFVIAADPSYHAVGLYESLGFEPRERVAGVCRRPGHA
jgi:ribosomal protein S18 acetylase RimI-like enzyme